MNYIEETEFQSFRSWASTASPQDLLEAFRSACLDVKKAEGWFMGVLSKKYDKPHRYYVILKYELYKRLGAKVPEPTSFWL